MNSQSSPIIILGLLLAIGLGSAGFFVSQTIFNGKVAINTAEAKGLATRTVVADKVTWELAYTVQQEESSDLSRLYKKAEQHRDLIIQLLKGKGFNDQEVNVGILSWHKQEFRNNEQQVVDVQHQLTGRITINSEQVYKVARVRADINTLIAQGLQIDNYEPAYHYTKLNDIKPAMLKEATKNAKVAANEFAQVAGVEVGGIRTARQGNFSVSDMGSSYSDTRTIEKQVRVVTTITFYLQ